MRTLYHGFEILAISCILCGLGVVLNSQESTEKVIKPLPTLTEVQKLSTKNVLLRLENAQLKLQAAQVEVEQARREAVAFIQPLAVEGYDLNLDTLMYTLKKETP